VTNGAFPFRVPLHPDQVPVDERGAGAMIDSESVLSALRLPTDGRLYDLDPGRFNGMPRDPLSPPFQIVTYRTPRGIRVDADVPYLHPDANPTGTAWIDELMIGTVHCGAHIDALSHVTAGDDDAWYGGFTSAEALGDFGPLRADAAKLPAIFARGVLLDIPGSRGERELPEGYEIRASDIDAALDWEGVELRRGDVVLVRTGQMSRWPDEISFDRKAAGIVLDGARRLVSAEPLAVGSDTSGFETRESEGGRPNNVHIHVLLERGIFIMEWLYLESLAEARAFEFLFVTLPLKIQGATGSWIRPVCIT
jgi:kynurenine formamidase